MARRLSAGGPNDYGERVGVAFEHHGGDDYKVVEGEIVYAPDEPNPNDRVEWQKLREAEQAERGAYRKWRPALRRLKVRVGLDSHVSPRLGHLPLHRLTPPVLARWQAAELAAGAGHETIVKARAMLSGVLRTAVEAGALTTNPVRAPRAPMREEVRPLAPSTIEGCARRRTIATRPSSPCSPTPDCAPRSCARCAGRTSARRRSSSALRRWGGGARFACSRRWRPTSPSGGWRVVGRPTRRQCSPDRTASHGQPRASTSGATVAAAVRARHAGFR